MNPQTVFYILIGIISIKFVFDTVLNALNAKHFNDSLPSELQGIYDDDEYIKSQNYKKSNYNLVVFTSTFSFIVTLLFFIFEGFAFVDELAKSFTSNSLLVTVLFFGIILFANDI